MPLRNYGTSLCDRTGRDRPVSRSGLPKLLLVDVAASQRRMSVTTLKLC